MERLTENECANVKHSSPMRHSKMDFIFGFCFWHFLEQTIAFANIPEPNFKTICQKKIFSIVEKWRLRYGKDINITVNLVLHWNWAIKMWITEIEYKIPFKARYFPCFVVWHKLNCGAFWLFNYFRFGNLRKNWHIFHSLFC